MVVSVVLREIEPNMNLSPGWCGSENMFHYGLKKTEKRPSVRPLVVLCRLYTVQAALTRGSVCVSVQDEAIKCVPQD